MSRKKKTVVVFHKHGPRPREQWHKLGADKPVPTKAMQSEYRRLLRQEALVRLEEVHDVP